LLEERLGYIDSIRDSYETELDFTLARKEVELDIHNLLQKQNEDLLKSDPILIGLIRRRQKLLDMIRAEGGITQTTAARQAELAQIRSDIIAQMTAQGATPQQIADMLAALPQFHRGGLVTGLPGEAETMARLQPGEYVVDRGTTRAIGSTRMPAMLDMLASAEGRIVAAGIMRKEAALLSFNQTINLGGLGGVSIANDFRGTSAEHGAAVMNSQFAEQFLRLVNRAIKSGEIRGPMQ